MLYQILACTIHAKIEKAHENIKLKISVPSWNDKPELPDGSYSVSDIQVFLEHIIKNLKHKIENRITFKIKSGYYLELLMPETMKLLGNTDSNGP